METVDIIASGYERNCPNCDHDNKEIEVTPTVKCNACEKEFEVDAPMHAHG